MKKFTLIILAGGMLSFFSCTQVTPIKPTPATPPSTNVITVSDAGVTIFDVNPNCNFVNPTSTSLTSIFTISMKIGLSSTFNLNLTVYGADTTDQGSYTEYNNLADGNSFSEFTNNGHGGTTQIYDYIVDSATVTITSHARNTFPINSDVISGNFTLNLRPNTNSLATTYKTVSGTFNTQTGNTTDQ